MEVSDSSRPGLGDEIKGRKEMTHVLATIGLRCMDLTRDQFPDTVDRVPSPIMISSPIIISSKDNVIPNPLIV